MMASAVILAGAPVPCRPGLRRVLTAADWQEMASQLPGEPGLAFVALWADAQEVHALFEAGGPVLVSAPVEAGLYAALSPARPGAALYERAVADLWGHQAANAVDVRPWLDHGAWGLLRPLSERPVPHAAEEPEVPEMLTAAGEAVSAEPVVWGPLPPGPAAGPLFWQAWVADGAVGQLEARGGWAHRGAVGLMRGKSPSGAARIAARLDGAATVAHAVAFARAVEAAQDTPAPPLGAALRGAMLTVERIAVRLFDLDQVAGALGQPWPAVRDARERLLAACGAVFGHRTMMDAVRPGGVVLEPPVLEPLLAALDAVPRVRRAWPAMGVLGVETALRLGLGGIAGRASGRMDPLAPAAAVMTEGGLAARMTLTAAAIEADVARAMTELAALPDGPGWVPLPHRNGEGLGRAAGPQGAVWHWVRLSGGLVAVSFATCPAWLLLPAVEAAAEGADPGDLGAIIASFGLRPAGMDL